MPFVDTGRLSMYYETAGEGAPPILLVHELGGNGRSWSAVQPALSERTSTYAVDLRGYGLTEKPPGPREVSDYADDLAAFVTALRLPPVDVIGIAMGAVIACALTMRHPERVRRQVLCDPTDAMTEDAKRYNTERAAKIRASGMRVAAAPSLKNSFPDAHAAARERYVPTYLANDPFAYAEASEALSRMAMTPDQFAAIRARTLVVTGRHDFIWPPAVGQRVAAKIKGAAFHVIEEAGHFPHIQTPDALLRLTRDFLSAA